MKVHVLYGTLVIAVTGLFFALGGSALAVGKARKPLYPCNKGTVKAYASVNLENFAGAFPQQFSSAANLFATRYSCNGKAAQVRAAGPGRYEIRFPGLSSRMVVVSSLAPEGGYASWDFGPGAYEVRVSRADGTPSNYGFSIAVY